MYRLRKHLHLRTLYFWASLILQPLLPLANHMPPYPMQSTWPHIKRPPSFLALCLAWRTVAAASCLDLKSRCHTRVIRMSDQAPRCTWTNLAHDKLHDMCVCASIRLNEWEVLSFLFWEA